MPLTKPPHHEPTPLEIIERAAHIRASWPAWRREMNERGYDRQQDVAELEVTTAEDMRPYEEQPREYDW